MKFFARKKMNSTAAKEKVVKLHFYVQDLRIGHVSATVCEVATGSITADSPYDFGSVHVLDDLVTAGPEIDSSPVGRMQGLTTNADLSTYGVAMNLNFYLTAGKFAGSTLSILGRNQVMDEARELPVVGGTGTFRFTRGYAIQKTYSIDFAANYAVLEYTIYATYDTKIGESDDDVVVAEF
ncbi:dirigent protein 21-like [Salvia miltiorrhiza]|uniref:dirigent protein 21-like n=1 Tax=Salvia miltiorrhiza TaxID=226208 RepID=UPI0025ACE17F|nr:dirigent protein 21-like [Salvia miltiorrhiza]